MNLSEIKSSSGEELQTPLPFTTHHSSPLPCPVVSTLNLVGLSLLSSTPSVSSTCTTNPNVTWAQSSYSTTNILERKNGVPISVPSGVGVRTPWNPYSPNSFRGSESSAGYVGFNSSLIGGTRTEVPPISPSQPISDSVRPQISPNAGEDARLSISIPLFFPPISGAPATPTSQTSLLMASSAPVLTPTEVSPPSGMSLLCTEHRGPSSSCTGTGSSGSRGPDGETTGSSRTEREETSDEEKIDVCGYKENLLLKLVEADVDKGNTAPQCKCDTLSSTTSEYVAPLISPLSSQCARSVPGLMKFFSKHKRSLCTSLSVAVSNPATVPFPATPPGSPISPGTVTVPPQRASLEASTMTSPTERTSFSRAIPHEALAVSSLVGPPIPASGVPSAPMSALTLLAVPETVPVSNPASPSSQKSKKQHSSEGKGTPKIVSLDGPPAPTSMDSLPPGITFPAPWPMPHNAIAHPGSYWLHPGQFSGVDTAPGLGLGYHVARDPLTGHLFFLSRPHPIADPSGHGLMWAGYGGVPPPPVVMTPQQLLLDHRYRPPTLHAPPPLMQLHPHAPIQQQSIKKEAASPAPSKESPKEGGSIPLVDVSPTQPLPPIPPQNMSPHFLYPPTSLPYYYPPTPHPTPFSLPAFPHPSNASLGLTPSLMTSLASHPFTPATSGHSSNLREAPSPSASSSALLPSSVWSRGTEPISSPGLQRSIGCIPSTDSEPPMDLTKNPTSVPPVSTASDADFHRDIIRRSPSVSIKREIKEEVASPAVAEDRERHSVGRLWIKPEVLRPAAEETPADVESLEDDVQDVLIDYSSAATAGEEVRDCERTAESGDLPVIIDQNSHQTSRCLSEERLETTKETTAKIPLTSRGSPTICSNNNTSDSIPAPAPAAFDSSGLELLLQTLVEHEARLTSSPVRRESDAESLSSQSEQMPHLERVGRTPSPRCSPTSFESQPPVLTPIAVPSEELDSPLLSPTTPPLIDSYSDQPPTLPSDTTCHLPILGEDPCYPSHSPPYTPAKPSGFSVLCALAEQCILEEEQGENCSALSSLAEVASSTPCVPTIPLNLSPNTQNIHSPSTPVNSFQDSTNCSSILANPPSLKDLSYHASMRSRPSQESPLASTSCDYPDFGDLQNADINRNYKSPESEREARAFIATKASQYHSPSEDLPPTPSYQIEDMDPSEVDMRKKLADLQRKYREKQRELSRLQPKIATSVKRGRGRPPKLKSGLSLASVVKRKVGRPLKRVKLEPSSPDMKAADNSETNETISGNKGLTLTDLSQSIDKGRWQPKTERKDDLSSEDESDSASAPPSLADHDPSLAFKPPCSSLAEVKQEESDDASEKSSKIFSQAETSVESCASDAELTSSSSNKRKPGRPKKHSQTKYDGTETIVAKKPKSLGFLLLSQKNKIRPKLKAELKVRNSEQDEDLSSHQVADPSHELSEDELDEFPLKIFQQTPQGKGPGGSPSQPKRAPEECRRKRAPEKVRRRGAPMGRSSMSRNAMLRDKLKRKSVFEKNSCMQELFRSLKRYSTIAAAEHDESEDEKEDKEIEGESKKDISIPLLTPQAETPSTQGSEFNQNVGAEKEEIDIKTEPRETNSSVPECEMPEVAVDEPSESITPAEDAPPAVEESMEEPQSQTPGAAVEDKEKENSVCRLLVEDLVAGARVLVLQDGLLYAGSLSPITPPDVYGIHIDGERGTRPHICCQDELLHQAWKEVKPGSTRFLTEGTRVCAFWSQQYRGLYPGCVAAACSPSHEGNHNLVNVEFDDGDSGRIHVDDIRLLPDDFPVIEYDPNPLISLNKRKRRPTEEDVKAEPKDTTADRLEQTPAGGSVGKEENKKETEGKKKKKIENKNDLEEHKRHKKRKKRMSESETSHKHKRKRKHKHHKHKDTNDETLFPHVEPGDSELRMRIRSPPPLRSDSPPPSVEGASSPAKVEKESPAPSSSEDESEKTSAQPQRRQRRTPSEKSRIAPFLPERQLWRWSGKGYKRPGSKGKGKKEFYKEIVRGKEHIRVGDCAVFLSSGSHERPYIGRVTFLWEGWGGNMVVKVTWFYHPDETAGAERKLDEPRGALFSSSHTDENDVQTISHKCHVVSLAEYRVRRAAVDRRRGPDHENYDLYYLAGHYDTTYARITMEPGVS